jgi:hypothetical protein
VIPDLIKISVMLIILSNEHATNPLSCQEVHCSNGCLQDIPKPAASLIHLASVLLGCIQFVHNAQSQGCQTPKQKCSSWSRQRGCRF